MNDAAVLGRVIVQQSGCWTWDGCQSAGRAMYWRNSRNHYVYRLLYSLLRGPLPTTHVLHHRCGDGACVNPWHLDAMLKSEHTRLHGAAITHCKRGHEFTPENTYRHSGKRHCRTCRQRRASDASEAR